VRTVPAGRARCRELTAFARPARRAILEKGGKENWAGTGPRHPTKSSRAEAPAACSRKAGVPDGFSVHFKGNERGRCHTSTVGVMDHLTSGDWRGGVCASTGRRQPFREDDPPKAGKLR